VVAGQLKLKAVQMVDFETEPSVNLTITATDAGALSYNELFAITVTNANEGPTITLTTIVGDLNEDADTLSSIVVATINVTDDALGTVRLLLSGADAGLFQTNGTNLELIAGAALDFEANPTLNVTVEVDDAAIPGNPDDAAAYTLTITNVNEPPNAQADSYNVQPSTPIVVLGSGVLANDVDPEGDSLSALLVSQPNTGSVSLNPDGSFVYDPLDTQIGTDQFTYAVSDGAGGTDVATVTISITGPSVEFMPQEEPPTLQRERPKNDISEPDNPIPSSDPMPHAEPSPGRRRLQVREAIRPPVRLPIHFEDDIADFRENYVTVFDWSSAIQIGQFSSHVPYPERFSSEIFSDVSVASVTSVEGFLRVLQDLRNEVRSDGVVDRVLLGSAVGVTTGLSLGYIVWLIRGGVLLSSLLSSIPAWQLVDPLPVLASMGKRSDEDDDDDSLESLIHQGKKIVEARKGEQLNVESKKHRKDRPTNDALRVNKHDREGVRQL
jgi:hypothetical protein